MSAGNTSNQSQPCTTGNRSLIDQLQMSARSLWWGSYPGIAMILKERAICFITTPTPKFDPSSDPDTKGKRSAQGFG